MLDVHPLTLFGRRRTPPALTSLVAIFYIIIFASLVAIFFIIILTSLVAIQLIFVVIIIFNTLSVNISVMLFTYHFGHHYLYDHDLQTKQRDGVWLARA